LRLNTGVRQKFKTLVLAKGKVTQRSNIWRFPCEYTTT